MPFMLLIYHLVVRSATERLAGWLEEENRRMRRANHHEDGM